MERLWITANHSVYVVSGSMRGCIKPTRLVRVAFDRDTERAAKPQIRNLQAVSLIVHKQVLRLQVAVHHAVLVAVRDSLHQLVHEALRSTPPLYASVMREACEAG